MSDLTIMFNTEMYRLHFRLYFQAFILVSNK